MKEWLALVARLVTGGVWVAAGVIKLPDPYESVLAVRSYQLLPGDTATTVGHLLPVVEIVVGVCLILGLLTRGAAVLSAVLFVAFIVGIVSVWVRGIDIDCGCFGGGGASADPSYLADTLRDLGWLAIAVYLIVVRRTKLALDDLLFRRGAPPVDDYSESSKKTELGSST